MKVCVYAAPMLKRAAPFRSWDWKGEETRVWILLLFLSVVFLTGGSAQAGVQSLAFLRPSAIIVAAYGALTLSASHLREYRVVLTMLLLLVLLTVAHLIPLPPGIWRTLPGRDIISNIDQLTGQAANWRPLSMVPEATWNALYALSVPIAVVLLLIQLGASGHRRVLGALIVLIGLSALVGALQLIGANISLYRIANDNAGLLANRNHQAVILSLLFPMLAAFVASNRSPGRERIVATLSLALAIIMVPLIIMTGSRAGLLISAVAILSVAFVLHSRGALQRRYSRATMLKLAAGMAVVIVAVIGATVFAARGNSAIVRFEGSGDDIRFPVWQSIVEVLPRYLPWGSGIGSYADVYQIAEPDNLLRPGFSNHAHNDYLELLFTAGLPGAILLAAAVILFGLALVKVVRSRGVNGLFNRLGLTMIALLAVASLADYPVRTPIVAAIFACAVVWAASFGKTGNEDGNVRGG